MLGSRGLPLNVSGGGCCCLIYVNMGGRPPFWLLTCNFVWRVLTVRRATLIEEARQTINWDSN